MALVSGLGCGAEPGGDGGDALRLQLLLDYLAGRLGGAQEREVISKASLTGGG